MMDELGQPDVAVMLVREGLGYPGNALELRRILARMCLQYEMWECARDALAKQFALDSSLASDTAFYFQMIGLAQTLSDTAQVARWTGEAVMRVESLVEQAWERVETARQEAERSEQVLTSLQLAQAGVYIDLGDKDAALAVYRMILERDPNNVRAPLAAAQLLTDGRFFVLESATPVDSHVLRTADSLLTSVAQRSKDQGVLKSVALIYLNVGTRLMRTRRVGAMAVRWLQNAVRFDSDSTLQGRSNAMLAVAILYLLEEVDTQLRAERTCDLAQLEAELVSQARAAIAASESEYPQVAADVAPDLQAIEELIPEIQAALGCDRTGR
jgi:tetratricopeptide (TPR) repeat protein